MFISVLSAQDHNGTIAGAELDALIRDLYIKNNSVCIQIYYHHVLTVLGKPFCEHSFLFKKIPLKLAFDRFVTIHFITSFLLQIL